MCELLKKHANFEGAQTKKRRISSPFLDTLERVAVVSLHTVSTIAQ